MDFYLLLSTIIPPVSGAAISIMMTLAKPSQSRRTTIVNGLLVYGITGIVVTLILEGIFANGLTFVMSFFSIPVAGILLLVILYLLPRRKSFK